MPNSESCRGILPPSASPWPHQNARPLCQVELQIKRRLIWSSTWHIFCHSGFSPHSECELCWSTCLLFQPLQISAEACQGLELEHWQVQHNPEEVSRIMPVKDASNVTLHVLDILLMPIDETVRTYSHLLLTHWSRPTAAEWGPWDIQKI